jgi:hypothetical protein
MFLRPVKIISGGQTGVDRGALDAAIALGMEHGGWCPRGRLAEDGQIPACYNLTETETAEYPARTQQNVIDADATLILFSHAMSGGTELTFRLAVQHRKPVLAVDLDHPAEIPAIRQWISANAVGVLNVAGPRESQNPGIQSKAAAFLEKILAENAGKQNTKKT